jgi:hypothetical protein
MAINPVSYTEKVVRSFLRYQLTAYPFADGELYAQMRSLLSLAETRQSPLLRGPYVSLSRAFKQGESVKSLIASGHFHPAMRQRIPPEITHVYGHQERAIHAIGSGRTTLVSTGTGSGKTECFLYPVVSRCLELKDRDAPPGICAVVVYPMNALAEDQLGRLRGLLAGTGITFGMYVGKTPDRENEVAGFRMPPGTTREAYFAKLEEVRRERRSETVYPPEEVCSREVMRRDGGQPRILLTNVKQLELLLTRQQDVELFNHARLEFLIFDEAHTYTGAQGAETACLIRRLRSYCGRSASDTVCIATSATIVDEANPNAARDFAARFFGVDSESVVTVGETYEGDVWRDVRTVTPAYSGDMAQLLQSCVEAVDLGAEADTAVRLVYARLVGVELAAGDWSAALHAGLSGSEIVYQLSELLAGPRSLAEVPVALAERVGRDVSEAEILAWLTLGAAARVDGRPLVRPVIHGFIRGISGAVVSFPDGNNPKLWLAAEDEIVDAGGESQFTHFPVMTCTTCGQHYFTAFLKDFDFTGRAPGGGEATGDSSYWEAVDESLGGKRVVLVNTIVGGSEDEGLEEDNRLAAVYFCRHCGSAHPVQGNRCLQCAAVGQLVELHAIRQKDDEDKRGYLSSCLSCGANGRKMGSRYREPARAVKATNVADVHVLAQDMVHHSERPRLLVFCDNRQDAAFQAGWMKDHARRFRLRSLMARAMQDDRLSVGDLAHALDEELERDETLSRALVPEVWQVVRKEGGGGRHERERRKYLRIQVLREVTLSARQALGLEPWGRMKVEYDGLTPASRWVQEHANALGIPPEKLCEGVASVLDYFRKNRVLHDPEFEIFTKYWMDGDLEIKQGYLANFGGPAGTKLRREPDEKAGLVKQWISDRGDTTLRQIARKWGVAADEVEPFLESLFGFLRDKGFLRPVQLKGARGHALPNVSGVYQVDADKLRLSSNHGVRRCCKCRRKTIRDTPNGKCPAWRCDGDLEFVAEDKDNYDLQLLDADYSMLRPEEHTAMVPHDERERLENLFKGESDAVNCFVCTPTLEMGVDIGQLDAILMRNVPPLPANYWQRAGRAGRRHRMAVDITYCRPISHDRAYFADPLKLLAGRIDPPAFNLRNPLMVAKHANATVLTRLHQLARDTALAEVERQRIVDALGFYFPKRISHYLFEDGRLRTEPLAMDGLRDLIHAHRAALVGYVLGAFGQGWPEDAAEVVTQEAIEGHVDGFVSELEAVIIRLRRRLNWAMDQIRRLNKIREDSGDLEPSDDALFKRCDRLVKRLKGTSQRGRRDAEGYDDSVTTGVLAAEGFLPGYGLETGSILGIATVPFWKTGAMDFSLPRPPSVALREYVPGNLIYANGNRFVARSFHRDVDEDRIEMPHFEVSFDNLAVKETDAAADVAALGAQVLQTIAVCDVDLSHQSHISDEEDLRFQLPVSVFGLEKDQHGGGWAYRWGIQGLHHRKGLGLRLVNVGASAAIERFGRMGYPLCTVCGQSVSPLSSQRQREHFEEQHTERCGRQPGSVGFYADIVADTISLPAVADRTATYSILETIRFAAARVLDMHVDDLQILVVGHVDRDDCDGLLWDPMPGGSGLLDQLIARWCDVLTIAKEIVSSCPSACDASCVDCLQTFRNGFYHKYLDRKRALDLLEAWGDRLTREHEIPPKRPAGGVSYGNLPVNNAEEKLKRLLDAAGFPEGNRGEQIRMGHGYGTTTPDIIFRAAHHDTDEGVCVYLDGLSAGIHGHGAVADKDRVIRDWLRNNGYEVIEIAANELDDPAAMSGYFRRLASLLREDEIRSRVRRTEEWWPTER